MYKRNAQGWSKHFDFMVLDLMCLQLAFALAVYVRHRIFAYSMMEYRNLAIILFFIDIVIIMLHNSFKDVVNRGYYEEIKETVKHCLYVCATATIYMVASQTGDIYSRIVLFLTPAFHIVIGYVVRILWKAILKKFRSKRVLNKNMLVVTTPESAEDILERLSSNKMKDYNIVGVTMTEPTGEGSVFGFPVVSDIDGAADYICREWVDTVYFDAPLTNKKVLKLMDDCAIMAIPTHYHVKNITPTSHGKHFSENIGGTIVLTSSINYATPIQLIMKRCFDIIFGIFGSIAALLIIAVIGPIIKIKSPGPIIFKQERIGKNGKRFKIYKLRSMEVNADKVKAKLMEQNRLKDGRMFKMEFDPRIIGNEILPDGTQKTGIGEFIRRTSLDEFPQFFNVLEGSMSTIGTRPPTPDEWEQYEYHHRARLSIKPGITGMWQVSGRSEITDFEEVVRLDTEYITNWSPGLDIKIFFKTIGVLFTGKGAM